MLHKVLSGVTAGLGVGVIALGALSVMGSGGQRGAPAVPELDTVVQVPNEPPSVPTPAARAAPEAAVEADPSVLSAAERILAEAAEQPNPGVAVRSARNLRTPAADVDVAASEVPLGDVPAAEGAMAGPAVVAGAGLETAAAAEPVAALATAPVLAGEPGAGRPARAPAPTVGSDEVLRGSSTPAISEPALGDATPAVAEAPLRPVTAETNAPQGPGPEEVAIRGALSPARESLLRPEPRPADLAASPAREPLPDVETAPPPMQSAAEDPAQPVLAVAPPDPVGTAPSVEERPAVLGFVATPDAPEPDGPTLAQATEPAQPAQPAPSGPTRIELQGSAMPRTDAVPVRRPDATPASAAPAPAAPASAVPEDAPAVQRFAAPFAAPQPPRPLLALVLLDDGSQPEASERLAGIGVPVSVAVDPSLPDATARMTALRAAGIEVLALARLPARPQPQDVEVFLGPALDAVPEAVAVLDLGEGGLRGRDATAQMALSRLARSGLGAVLTEGGFGGGVGAAEAAGVPAAEILRDLDGAGQDTAAILRQLDDAVRRAGQEGEATVLARLNPETLQIIEAWTREGRAAEVALAPVSALLQP